MVSKQTIDFLGKCHNFEKRRKQVSQQLYNIYIYIFPNMFDFAKNENMYFETCSCIQKMISALIKHLKKMKCNAKHTKNIKIPFRKSNFFKQNKLFLKNIYLFESAFSAHFDCQAVTLSEPNFSILFIVFNCFQTLLW